MGETINLNETPAVETKEEQISEFPSAIKAVAKYWQRTDRRKAIVDNYNIDNWTKAYLLRMDGMDDLEEILNLLRNSFI